MDTKTQPNIFFSYSWDSPEHQNWVIDLADLIESKGGKSIIDRKHLPFGGHIKTFMLKSLMDSDIVLIILTPKYKMKADSLQGGAGYEYNIINDELFKMATDNQKFIPIIREGSFDESTTLFLQGFNCVDLRKGATYSDNLQRLIDQILTNSAQTNKADITLSTMNNEFAELFSIESEIKLRASQYFEQLFPVKGKDAPKKMLEIVLSWESLISEYNKSFVKFFNEVKMEMYEDVPEDFRTKIFGVHLWTVKAALGTQDPDLARYKKDFRAANPTEIFDTVSNILNGAHQYADAVAPKIDYSKLLNINDLKLGFLDEEHMILNKVIGSSIRSETLHRYYPEHFPIMTQPSLWSMYFICEKNHEFITIEKRVREGKMRVSHNWQYPYARFVFLMNFISILLTEKFAQYGVTLNEKYRFGYVNMFLSQISELHKADSKLLHEWVKTN